MPSVLPTFLASAHSDDGEDSGWQRFMIFLTFTEFYLYQRWGKGKVCRKICSRFSHLAHHIPSPYGPLHWGKYQRLFKQILWPLVVTQYSILMPDFWATIHDNLYSL
jgi:hypothetical protein